MDPKLIWQGDAASARWELYVTRVYEGPLAFPDFEATSEGEEALIPGSHGIVWTLRFVSSADECIDGWWEPETRLLGVQLRGWSKSSIGILKRHLIRLGNCP